MLVNFQQIKTDILGTKTDAYLLLFPTLAEQIKTFKAKPTCGACEKNIIEPLFTDPQCDEKLKVIYGNDITVDKNMPKPPPPMPTQLINESVPIDLYDEWSRNNLDAYVRFLNTVYIPEHKAVKVFAIKMIPPPMPKP
jgi:hypothetical protein